MLARRILAVSPDKAFADQLSVALEIAGRTVDVHRSLDTLGSGGLHAALCVIHVVGPLAHAAGAIVPRLTGDCRVIVMLPRSNLAAIVAILRGSDRVAGVMIAEDFDAGTLRSMALRALSSDVFGLEKAMLPGVELQTQIVGEHHDKAPCVARISAFVAQARVPRRHHESIEQCIDEMLTNALYDAPVDAQGNPLFSDITTRTRRSLRTEQTVVVQYAHDGARFGISVRDAFGSLSRQTVLRSLHKCLNSTQQIDRKVSGAGVGLYLMVSSASSVSFNVIPGVATEVVCTFTVASPKLVLDQFGLFWEPSDVTGRLSASPPPRLTAAAIRPSEPTGPHPRRRFGVVGIAAVAVVIAVAGVLAYSQIVARTEQAAPGPGTGPAVPIATVAIDSQPTGAAVEIDGTTMGSTPLALTSLVPGAEVSIVFKRTGYIDATARVRVPALGERMQLVQPLQASADVVRVHIVSKPPGARVLREGEAASSADRTYTPADVFVEANKVQRFTLTMPGHVPLVLEPFTPPRGAGVIEKTGTLKPE